MKTFLRIAVSAAVLALLFWRFGTADVLTPCMRADPTDFLVAFAIYLASQVLSAWRWQKLGEGVGFRVPFARYCKVYFIGMFFGLVVPSTIGADAARALYLGRAEPGRARALSTVVFDRVIGLIGLVAIAIGAILFGPSESLPGWLVLGILAVGVLLIGGWLSAPFVVKLLPEGQRWRRLVEEDLTPYFRDPGVILTAFAASLVIHALQIWSQDLLVDSIGLAVSRGFVAIYHPLVSLAAAIPFTIGGFGLREAAYAYLLPYAGILPDDAVALGLLWWAVGALGALCGGLVYAVSSSEPIALRSPTKVSSARSRRG